MSGARWVAAQARSTRRVSAEPHTLVRRILLLMRMLLAMSRSAPPAM